MMSIEEIQKLIERYWDGETTFEEENAIVAFFTSNSDLPPELEQWRDWFSGKAAISYARLDDTIEDRILAYTRQNRSKVKQIRFKHLLWLSAAAAVLILSVVVFRGVNFHRQTPVSQEIASADIQEDYEKVKMLLLFTSCKMNQTEEVLEKNLNKIDRMNEYININ